VEDGIVESGKIKSSELAHRRNTVEEFFSPSVSKIKLLMSRCHHPLKTVGEIAQVRGGKRLPPNTPYFDNSDGSGVPYIRTTDIRPETCSIDLSNIVYIDDATHQIISRYQLQQNDIVLSIAGTIGAIGILHEPLVRCNFNENMSKVRVVNPELLTDYVAAYLGSGFGQAFIDWSAGGAVLAKLSLERIEQILIPIPSVDIQRQIIGIMQAAYKEREKLLAQIQTDKLFDEDVLSRLNIHLNIEAFSKTFTLKRSQFISGRDDYRYYSPESRAVLTALSNFKETARLGRIVESITNGTDCREYGNYTAPYLRVAQIKYGMVEFKNVVYVPEETLDEIPLKLGNILFTRKGSPGNAAVVDESITHCVISSEIMRIILKPGILPTYFAAFCNSILAKAQVERCLTGSLNYGINQRELRELVVPIPSTEIQNAIAEAVVDKQKQLLAIEKEAQNIIAEAKHQVDILVLGEEFTSNQTGEADSVTMPILLPRTSRQLDAP
jgi:type I restriction enzyme M protein